MNSSEERVGKLLGTLPRVEAPGDFDFRVKARIAQGRPSSSGSWLPASLKVAVPLVLLLVVGFVGFSVLNSSGEANVPVVAEVTENRVEPLAQPFTDGQPDVVAIETSDPVDVQPPGDNRLIERTNSSVRAGSAPKPKDEDGGGSFDAALSESRPILPQGFEPGGTITPNTMQVPVRQVLSGLGITARFASGWQVSSVSPGSIAARAGVKAGDVIEAVNGRTLAEASTFETGFIGSSLRVRRGGQTITLNLGR